MKRLFKDILVAVDGSKPSQAALTLACDLAKQLGATLHVRYVLATHPQLSGRHVTWLPEVETEKRREAAEISQAAYEFAKRHGVNADARVIDGEPVDDLLRAADELGVDTIVIGNRGQSAFSTLLMGSVAQGVTERSTLPVLVVHESPVANEAINQAPAPAAAARS
jgi:nucleotide-binding universal stress UspA family protein